MALSSYPQTPQGGPRRPRSPISSQVPAGGRPSRPMADAKGHSQSLLGFVGDVLEGGVEGVGDMVDGLVHMVIHPIQTVEGLAMLPINLLTRPGAVIHAFTEPFTEAIAEGHSGRAIGMGLVEVGTLLMGPQLIARAVDAAGSAGQAGALAKVASIESRGTRLSKAASAEARSTRLSKAASAEARSTRLSRAASAEARRTRVSKIAKAAGKRPPVAEVPPPPAPPAGTQITIETGGVTAPASRASNLAKAVRSPKRIDGAPPRVKVTGNVARATKAEKSAGTATRRAKASQDAGTSTHRTTAPPTTRTAARPASTAKTASTTKTARSANAGKTAAPKAIRPARARKTATIPSALGKVEKTTTTTTHQIKLTQLPDGGTIREVRVRYRIVHDVHEPKAAGKPLAEPPSAKTTDVPERPAGKTPVRKTSGGKTPASKSLTRKGLTRKGLTRKGSARTAAPTNPPAAPTVAQPFAGAAQKMQARAAQLSDLGHPAAAKSLQAFAAQLEKGGQLYAKGQKAEALDLFRRSFGSPATQEALAQSNKAEEVWAAFGKDAKVAKAPVNGRITKVVAPTARKGSLPARDAHGRFISAKHRPGGETRPSTTRHPEARKTKSSYTTARHPETRKTESGHTTARRPVARKMESRPTRTQTARTARTARGHRLAPQALGGGASAGSAFEAWLNKIQAEFAGPFHLADLPGHIWNALSETLSGIWSTFTSLGSRLAGWLKGLGSGNVASA